MATLSTLLRTRTRDQVAAFLQVHGYPVLQPRIVEAVGKGRKGRPTKSQAKARKQLQGYIDAIPKRDVEEFRKHGLPDEKLVANTRRHGTPVIRQYSHGRMASRHNIDTPMRTKKGKLSKDRVTKIEIGNTPHYDRTGRIYEWPGRKNVRQPAPGEMQVLGRSDMDRLIAIVTARFGESGDIRLLVYGTFMHPTDPERYKPSRRFQGWNESYYSHTISVQSLLSAYTAVNRQVLQARTALKRHELEVGDPLAPDRTSNFAARVMTVATGVRYAEVNFINVISTAYDTYGEEEEYR